MDMLEKFLGAAEDESPVKVGPKTPPGIAKTIQDIEAGVPPPRITWKGQPIEEVVPGYQQPAQPSSDPLESFLSGGKPSKAPQVAPQTAPQTAPQAAPVDRSIPTAEGLARPDLEAQPVEEKGGIVYRTLKGLLEPRRITQEAVKGLGEAGLTMATALPATAAGWGLGLAAMPFVGKNRAEELKNLAIEGGTYQPRTETGKAILQGVGKVAQAVGPLPEIVALTPAIEAGAATGAARARAIPGQIRATAREIGVGLTPEEAAAQFAARRVAPGSAGAARTEPNPYAGQITGEEAARGVFPQVKLSKIKENVPVGEQATRAQIANEILGDTGKVRPGVVSGNEDTLRTEYTLAKSPQGGPAADVMKRQIADEQTALSNYAEQRVRNTGASETLTTPYERGERINSFFAGAPIEGEAPSSLTSFFRQEKQRMYDEAREKVGNNPISSSHVDSLLADPQFRAGLKLTGTEGVAGGAQDLIKLAKTTGFKDAQGNFYAPNTIGAWDAVRKALNQGWTPSNAKVIRNINRAIDNDIASAGGGDLLKRADSLHQMEKTVFGSKGIKGVFGEVDSNGVETGKIGFDKLPQQLNSMPFNQWKHIYDTADKLARGELRGPVDAKTGQPKWVLQIPPELRAAAQSAKSEMLGNIAREVQTAGAAKEGVWNQNAANKVLNARADKIKYAFPLDEQQAFYKLNYGGYLMPGVHGYEGAALQGRRLGLIEGNLERAGTAAGATAGGFIAGAPGAAVGGYLGTKGGAKAAEAVAARKAVKEARKIEKQLKKTSTLSEMLPKD